MRRVCTPGARSTGPLPLSIEGVSPENAFLSPDAALHVLDTALKKIFGQIGRAPIDQGRSLTPFELSIGASPERLEVNHAAIGAAARGLIDSFAGPGNAYGGTQGEPISGGFEEPLTFVDIEAIEQKVASLLMELLAGLKGAGLPPAAAASAKPAAGELLKTDSEFSQVSDPATVDPKCGRTPGPGADASERFDSLVETRTKEKAYGVTDPATRADLIIENADRRAAGKEPPDLTLLTAALETIREDTTLSNEDREKKIEEVRKKFDLGEDTMRQLGTRRLGRIYAQSGAEAEAIAASMIGQLKEKHSQAVQLYGADSTAAPSRWI